MTERHTVNNVNYWDQRFGFGDWQKKGGFSQTRSFAMSQLSRLNLPTGFTGSICDFGCGAGDAFSVYRQAFPHAKLLGVDFSHEAVHLCRDRYSAIAEFIEGGNTNVPNCDVIIASNVLEHLVDDRHVVLDLLNRCECLFVIVPYQELDLSTEHLRAYGADSFSDLPVVRREVFASQGWSEFGLDLVVGTYLRKVLRPLLGRPIRRRKLQIPFEFRGSPPTF